MKHVCFLCFCFARFTPAVAAELPNVLFILSEDQGAHLSLLETPGLQTPNIDAIARGGVYFDHAFVAYPVCSASKAALYTGLHGHTNGILNNTHNYHKPAHAVTKAERTRHLAQVNRVGDRFLTLPEMLRANGYYLGVTHKLHVLPNEKFPYDSFMHGALTEIRGFLKTARERSQPWFLMVNIPYSHRPYPNSDRQSIRVDPDQIRLPGYLPDTPLVRQDWAEYLAGIEKVDRAVGETIAELRASGHQENTIVIYMSDHGPTFQHGKMTLYDLGLRVPLAISGPGIKRNVRSGVLASELDLLPTLLEWIERQSGQRLRLPGTSDNRLPYPFHGVSLANVLDGDEHATGHDFIFAEISNRGPLPNDGIQERSVSDGRWKLIYREKVDRAWRQVNADSRMFKTWGNRTYDETIRRKDQYPMQYRILAEMDPQELGGVVPELELYDLETDPDELRNLASNPEHRVHATRLMNALRRWARATDDPAIDPPDDLSRLIPWKELRRPK
jgi:N-sulfoglucosamine sulfohydrolase